MGDSSAGAGASGPWGQSGSRSLMAGTAAATGAARGAAAGTAANYGLGYDGRLGRIYAIWLLNLVLNIVTLGIYSFWGKTRIRRYVARSFTLRGDRFEYIGTGGELFRGFLLALPFIIVVYAPLLIWPPEIYPVTNLLFIVIFYLIGVAVYAALRYRMTRTVWRGIRGYLSGSAFTFGAISFGYSLLSLITLGLLIPFGDRAKLKYQMGNMWFGNTQAVFDPKEEDLWPTHLITYFLVPFTLGLSRIWYSAAVFRFQVNNMAIAGVKLRAHPTGGQLFWLVVPNTLILLFTLGIGMPIITQRNMNYIARHVSFEGDVDAAVTRIQQSTEALNTTGEGLDGALGLDSGLF